MQRLLTAAQVAEQLQVSSKHIYALASSGQLAHIRIGERKALRFTESAIQDFLNQRTTNTQGADATHDSGNGGE